MSGECEGWKNSGWGHQFVSRKLNKCKMNRSNGDSKWGMLAQSRPIDMYGMYSDFFHGSMIKSDSSKRSSYRAGQCSQPLRVRKNLANLSPVFMPDGCHLVVNAQVREVIERHAKVEFVPAIISEAWWYEYGANEEYLHDSVWKEAQSADEFDIELVLDAFVEKYRVQPPRVDLFCVCDYGWWLHHSGPGIPALADAEDAALASEVRRHLVGKPVLSRSLIELVGMYYSRGYICTPRLLSELVPFLEPSFFVTHVQDF